jgi:hypothetical protein
MVFITLLLEPSRSPRLVLRKEGIVMTFHMLFWALCAVVAANVAVAVIAIAKAYRDERRLAFPNRARRGLLS